jgi:glycosyltransferase involved in cell wall biosynthesis
MLDKNSTPLISVIIPTYNRANYLERCIDSVLNQTFTKFELIVIDDFSTDNTDAVIANYKDSRIRYYKNKSNGIVASSRNLGIKKSKGSWIAFLDSDDWWDLSKLKNCVEFFNTADLIYHNLHLISKKNKFLLSRKNFKTRQLKEPILKDLLLSGNVIANSSVIVRKNLLEQIGLINESRKLVASEDYNTWLKISKITDKFLYLPKKLGYYFVHDQNISHKNMSFSYQEATQEFIPILNNAQKKKLEANIKYISGKFHYQNLNYSNAKNDLFYVIMFGAFKLKIRSIIMLIRMMIRLN